MNTEFLTTKFNAALSYADYVKTGTDEQQRRWAQAFETSSITQAQKNLIESFARKMHVLVVSGIWCGDCVFQCTLMQRIAAVKPAHVQLRFVDRDLHSDLSSQLKINGGARVPVALFMAEDFELCSIYGERPLSRYRALARKQLGDSCEIFIAPPNPDEQAATLVDWLNEFERMQLMLRISPRLRQLHGD
jgi:hypothetical protein